MRNKSILFKLVEFIDIKLNIFEQRSSWDTEEIA